jgi:membrane protease subunit HflC
MHRLTLPLIMLALLAVLIAGGTLYQVDETEQAVVTQFGEPVRGGTVTTPGLHVKVPVIQTVRRFDKCVLEWDGQPGQMVAPQLTVVPTPSLAEAFERL